MNDKTPLVSIMCTAFNHEQYIRQTLESFLMQETNFPFEIIVNDDCSTDGTAAIIREFEEKYPDIFHVFYQPKNLWSQGIDLYTSLLIPAAKGKYCAYCEGDDYWTDPTKLQQQFDFMEAHPDYSACVHNTILHRCRGEEPDHLLLQREGDYDVEFSNLIAGMESSFHTSSIFARKEMLLDPPEFYFSSYAYGFLDHPLAFILRKRGRIHLINKPMSVYRVDSSANSWSAGVHGTYGKLVRFIHGKIALLEDVKSFCPPEDLPTIDEFILRHEFELMYIEGRDKEQRKPPYNRFLKEKPFSYRMNNAIKSYLPWVQKAYRRMRGYHE